MILRPLITVETWKECGNSETFLRILLAILENDFITLLLAECVIKEEPNLKVHMVSTPL